MASIVLCGSRNREGQTARAAAALASGAAEAGGAVRTVYLPEADIQRCRQCDADGWGLCRREGRCIIEDSFEDLVSDLRAADCAVFVTPVYFGELSEGLRAFLDRLRRITRHDAAQAGIAGKPAIAVCVAGGGGGGAPACAAEITRILGTCGFDVLDSVPVRRQNLEMKLQVLEITGRWLMDATSPGEPKAEV
ncbi:MAG: flavodoxin family protein [Armatimonadetes bacterium]|nr:flavodoxin family protein [Armatimonadota bacterium]